MITHFLHLGRNFFTKGFQYSKKTAAALFGALSFLLVTLTQGATGIISLLIFSGRAIFPVMVRAFQERITEGKSFFDALFTAILAVVLMVAFLTFLTLSCIVLTAAFSIYSLKLGAEKGWDKGFIGGLEHLWARIRLGFTVGYMSHINEPTPLDVSALIKYTFELNWKSLITYLSVFYNNQGTHKTAGNRITPEEFDAMEMDPVIFEGLLRQQIRLSLTEITILQGILGDNPPLKALLTAYQERKKILEETGECPIFMDRDTPILVFQQQYQNGQWLWHKIDTPTIYNKEALKNWCYERKAELPHNRSSMMPLEGEPVEGAIRVQYHPLMASIGGREVVVSEELTELALQLKNNLPTEHSLHNEVNGTNEARVPAFLGTRMVRAKSTSFLHNHGALLVVDEELDAANESRSQRSFSR